MLPDAAKGWDFWDKKVTVLAMVSHTPMMQQYLAIKDAHPDFLLFYRMGDFFELFGDDAQTASKILDITLTQRRSSKDEEGTPMCGVPHHAAEAYIAKLIAAGHKVALCEQTETPEEAKARGGAKALVKREVTRLFTSGTLTEDHLLPATAHQYLAAVAEKQGNLGLAWLDLSTGDIGTTTTTRQDLAGELARLMPGEIVLTGKLMDALPDLLTPYRLTEHSGVFSPRSAEAALKEAYAVAALDAFGLSAVQTLALGGVIGYAQLTQLGKLPTLQPPTVHHTQTVMHIDAASRQHLELTQTLQGESKGSLLQAIDCTVSAAGGRLLRDWLTAPLIDLESLHARQHAVQTLYDQQTVRATIRNLLKHTADMGRALSRITLDRGGPRDLNAIRQSLLQAPHLQQALNGLSTTTPQPLLSETLRQLTGLDEVLTTLQDALQEENLPLLARDGGFVADGYDNHLDHHRQLAANGTQMLHKLEQNVAKNTEIPSLKIKYNKVWGYFFEITHTHKNKVPENFIHRQTTTGSGRYTTEELMTLERDLSAAESSALRREQIIFKDLVQLIHAHAPALRRAAEALATLDVLTSLAELAQRQGYVCPTLDDSTTFAITAGRHPVVERTVESFVANDSNLTDGQLWLLTGPNMAGKSTYLRQNALIAILAQMGSFVPAQSAHIGLVDKIFTRIGAADDLSRGQSTFMVEMVETATILRGATANSLVILDEIGRGTATYDGLAIAWACVEHLSKVSRCRGLFATHYHELTALADQLENVHTHHVVVKEWKGDVVFLHEVAAGCAPRSYGIHVAKLAGLPAPVVARAQDILQGLEKAAHGKKAANAADLPLFTAPSSTTTAPQPTPEPEAAEMANRLLTIDLDELSPREAQNLLYDLRIMAASRR